MRERADRTDARPHGASNARANSRGDLRLLACSERGQRVTLFGEEENAPQAYRQNISFLIYIKRERAEHFLFRAPRNENNIKATRSQCDRRITSVRIKFYNRRAPHKGDTAVTFFSCPALSVRKWHCGISASFCYTDHLDIALLWNETWKNGMNFLEDKNFTKLHKDEDNFD